METEERLMRSALRLFATRGYTATTIEDITDAADIGKGTFFNYFPSKEHIFATHAMRQAEKTLKSIEDMRRSTGPMERVVRKLIMSYVDEDNISPTMYRNILVAICSNDSVRAMMVEGIERARKGLAELMMLGQQRGEIRDDLTPEEAATEFQRAFSGTMLLWAFAPTERPWSACRKEIMRAVWLVIRSPKKES